MLSRPVEWWTTLRTFLTEVRNEMKRVTWPSRKEVYATTVVVILVSVFFGVYLWASTWCSATACSGSSGSSVGRHDGRRDDEALVHRPHLLGLREEGGRVARTARAGYGLQDEIGEILIPTEDVVEMRGGRKVVSAEAVLPRLHPGRDEHDRPRVARGQEHAEGHRLRRRGRASRRR